MDGHSVTSIFVCVSESCRYCIQSEYMFVVCFLDLFDARDNLRQTETYPIRPRSPL